MSTRNYRIMPMEREDGPALAGLFRRTIPEATLCAMGIPFLSRFLYAIHRCEGSGVWVARGVNGDVAGFIVGTLNRRRCYREIVHRWGIALVFVAWLGVVSPPLWRWVWRRLARLCRRHRSDSGKMGERERGEAAEMLAIAVEETSRGGGLADELVSHMESHFRAWGLTSEYVILTLEANVRANRFYQRMGAELVSQGGPREQRVNTYVKRMVP